MTRAPVEGRFYSVKKEDPSLPDIDQFADCHMVLVLDRVRGNHENVEVMKVTTECRQDGEYLPISPTKKKPYPIQLRLVNGPEYISQNKRIIHITKLPQPSYLKIDSRYELPISSLHKEVDKFGDQIRIPSKGQGGLGHVRDHTHRRDRVRHQEQDRQTHLQLQEHQRDEEELCRLASQQSLEDSGNEHGEGSSEVLIQD